MKVFVRGFDRRNRHNTEENIKDFFEQFGGVENVRLMIDPKSKSIRGFVYIKLLSRKTREKLLRIRYFKFRSQKLEAVPSMNQYPSAEKGSRNQANNRRKSPLGGQPSLDQSCSSSEYLKANQSLRTKQRAEKRTRVNLRAGEGPESSISHGYYTQPKQVTQEVGMLRSEIEE